MPASPQSSNPQSSLGYDPSEEPGLIARSRQGDTRAFSRLVFRYQGAVRAYVQGSVWHGDLADDLAQEVFFTAFRSLGEYRGEAQLAAWLLGIARNKVLMHLRSETRRMARENKTVDDALAPWRAARLESDAGYLDRRSDELQALRRCLEKLPAASADVVVEHYFKDRDPAEIARATGKREGTVRMTLLRVRQALRDCMQGRIQGELGPEPAK